MKTIFGQISSSIGGGSWHTGVIIIQPEAAYVEVTGEWMNEGNVEDRTYYIPWHKISDIREYTESEKESYVQGRREIQRQAKEIREYIEREQAV